MTASVIVPARELNGYGRRCVARLLALDGAPEVIVVTDREAKRSTWSSASPHGR